MNFPRCLPRLASLVAAASAVSGLLGAQPPADRQDWIPLFNGRDLTGWRPKIRGYPFGENFGNTFRVENGVLRVAYDQYDTFDDRFGHLFYRDKFSYYIIAVEYRFTGEQAPGGPPWAFRNSGIMVHCQPPETMLRDQRFPASIEVQLLGGSGTGERPTANVCSPGTHIVMSGELVTKHCNPSRSPTFHGDQWVRVEVTVYGGETIRHVVNGEEVLSYEKPQIGGATPAEFGEVSKREGELLTEGYISLQSESHPIEFRKVELLDLVGCMDPQAKNYRKYFVKADRSRCRY